MMFGWMDFNPLLALDRWLAMLRWGRGVHFVVAGRNGGAIYMLLKRYGIKMYAIDPPHKEPNQRGFRVRAEQAQWAAYLLQRAGYAVLKGPRVTAKPGPMPAAWGVPARSVGLTGRVLDFFQRF